MNVLEVIKSLIDSDAPNTALIDEINKIYNTEEDSKHRTMKLNDFKNHKIMYRLFHSEYVRDSMGTRIRNGKKYKNVGYEEFRTLKGDIKAELWYSQALELIENYNENYILECLYNHVKSFAWLRLAEDKKAREYAIELHISRIFENKEWVNYEVFKSEYLNEFYC